MFNFNHYLAISLFLAASFASGADHLTAFGFEIGKPLNFPICEAKGYNGIPIAKDTICIENLKGGVTGVNTILHFPFGETPHILAREKNEILASLNNGMLAGFVVDTLGVLEQEKVFQTLVTKYGKPSKSRTYMVGNKNGDKYEVIEAKWNFSDLFVTYNALIGGNPNRGQLRIETPEWRLKREAWIKEGEKEAHAL